MSSNNSSVFYDNIAEKYHWFFSSWDNVMERQAEDICLILKNNNVKNVLDCACGTGMQTIGLAKQGFNVVGSDLSNGMLRKARENASKASVNVDFINSSFCELEKNISETFDAVICMGNSIPHLLLDSDIKKALESMYNRLNPNGTLLIDMRNYDNMLERKPKFLPMRINAEKDEKVVSVLYVFDYLEKFIRFNIVYLIQDLKTDERKMEVESVDYNPIRKENFLKLLSEAGFRDISIKESGANLYYNARR